MQIDPRFVSFLIGRRSRYPVRNWQSSVGLPPTPDKLAFLTWRSRLVNLRVAQGEFCSVAKRYFFSTSGSDSNDGLTEQTPKQTLSAATTLISSEAASGVEINLKRGDRFEGNITTAKGRVKIRAYGTGQKPRITHFRRTGYSAADDAWTADSGNLYHKTTNPALRIGWIREVNNPYNPYMFLTSSADVALVPYSWHQTVLTANFTVNSSTDVITSAGHGLNNNDVIYLRNTGGALPAGSSGPRQNYYVIGATTDTFQISLTQGGAAVNFTGTGTGTHSWNKAGVLYINAGNGINPNDVDFEVVTDWNSAIEGIAQAGSTGDATTILYCEDIVTEGFGVSPDSEASLGIYGIHAGVSGNDLAVLNRCEAYYTGRHGLGHTNGAVDGGIFVLKDCAAGYGSIDATSYVSFSGGNGLETHYEGCSNPFGKLPSEGYGAIYGPVYPGGGWDSGIYAHTGGTTLGLLTVWGHRFEDNRATYPRATYELGAITAANLPGTYSDLSSLRAFFNHAPIERLVEIAEGTVTVNSSTDVVNQAGHAYEDGDLVQISSTATMPGGVTQNRSYAVVNATANDYQIGGVSIDISSTGVDASTDTLTCISAHAINNGDRLKIRADIGQLPGGLDPSILYYAVNASGSTLQLSLTNGGAAVDITDKGFGRFRLYGQIVNITSAGTGTLTSRGVDVSRSAFAAVSRSDKAIYINNKITGLQFRSYGQNLNSTSFNNIIASYNLGGATSSLKDGGGRDYHAHFQLKGRGSFWYINSILNANAVMFNSIVNARSNVITNANNIPNDTDHIRGTAYYDPTGNLAANIISADDMKVPLATDPVLGAAPLPNFDVQGFVAPNGVNLEYDFYSRGRDLLRPAIGPVAKGDL